MIDPLIALAFAVESSPGVYALLLGSGVSRATQIPTGWEVTLDLIRQIAKLSDEDCGLDPAKWFEEKYGEEPDYSKLLQLLGPNSAERNRILRKYFEPTSDELEQGIKRPSEAHKAIAKLAASNHIRVIITTNFDHLMEQALKDEGITPVVISTAEGAKGAPPIAHGGCFVIKVHGDYLDTRFKNTTSELANIEKPMRDLLGRIFDEYGLVICGWSAVWDTGLRKVIEQCKNHRYTTYWTTRNSLDGQVERLVALRKASVISIESADSFFVELAEKVQSLQEFSAPHPLSINAAVASIKRYLAEDKYRIRLHDLMHNATEELCAKVSDDKFPIPSGSASDDEFKRRISQYRNHTDPLLALIVAGCYWGRAEHSGVWIKAIERVGNVPALMGGLTHYLKLRHYPAALLIYGAGIAALAGSNHDTLSTILSVPVYRHHNGETLLIEKANAYSLNLGCFEEFQRHFTPGSKWIFDQLRHPLKEYAPDEKVYEHLFDQFEYLLGLVLHKMSGNLFIGAYGWRHSRGLRAPTNWDLFTSKIKAMVNVSEPLMKLLGLNIEDTFKTFNENVVRGTKGWW